MKKFILVIFFVLFGFLFFATDTFAATYTVTKTADTNDGTCDADCSLREAVASANANSGADTVAFDISSGDANYNSTDDTWTITLGTVLSISTNQSITIDGSTQTGNGTFPTYGGKIVLLTSANVQTLSASGGTSDVTLIRLTFKNTSSTTQTMIGGTTAVFTLQYSYFTRDIQSPQSTSAVAPTATGNVVISNNKIDMFNRGFQSTNITNASATTVYDSNVVVDAISIGMRPTGYNITVSNNTFSSVANLDQAIVSSCTGGTCTIEDNSINVPNAGAFAAIAASGAGTYSINNNTINTSHVRAISITSAGTIENNTISGTSGSASNGKIHVDTNDTSKLVVIQNNTINVSNAIPVWITSASTRATVRSNVITSSSQYTPINLNGGTENANLITINDTGDVDTGTNDLMNHPNIEWAEYIGNHRYEVYGSLDGNASEAPYTIELCKSNNQSAGHGGCEVSLATFSLATSGGWNTTVTISGDDADHLSYFSALATNSSGSTSEFGGTVRARVRGASTAGTPHTVDLIPYIGGIITRGDVTAIVTYGTFNWDVYLKSEETPKIGVYRIPNTIYWQVSSKFDLNWLTYYGDIKVLSTQVLKPFILVFKYNPLTMEKTLSEKRLKLAYSHDSGKTWKLLNSVLDTKNHTVAVVTKNNGLYMLVSRY